MESLREEGYDVDRSDPYATLTGQISWSESTLADGHAPLANGDAEPVAVAEPVEEIAEPFTDDEPFTIAEPVTMAEPVTIAEPVTAVEPVTMTEPVTMAEPVSAGAAPAPVREDQPVVWRAPAQSQVIILAVSLRALADAVAATVTQEAWERFDDAYAQIRGRFQNGDGDRRPSSIDVHAHERRSSNGPGNGWAPRRNGPRPGGAKHISWRAR
jgi:hypothetical protein